MIDYYQAIDLETGQEIPHLKEVSLRLAPEMPAVECFRTLSFLREELEERWTNGTLDQDGQRLQEDLPKIRTTFMSDHDKNLYDRALKRAWNKRLEANQPKSVQEAKSYTESDLAKKAQGLEEAAQTLAKVEANKGLSVRNMVLAGLAFVVLLALILFFNVNLTVLLIGAVLIVALMLLMS